MTRLAQEAKLPALKTLLDRIAMVKARTGISLRDHVNFGTIQFGELEVFADSDGDQCIGGRNENNNLFGRGIVIYLCGDIFIGYFENGQFAPGNYTHFDNGGMFEMGEWYLKDGEMKKVYSVFN